MYAVFSSGGKQYRVEPGTTLTMERIGAGAGEPFTFDRVLLIGDGDEVTVGTPVVAGATVSATVLGEEAGPKLVIFKFKQKVKYRRRTGHRQHLVRVRIDAINADGGRKAKASEKPSKAEAAPATEEAAAPAAETAKPAPKPRASRAKAKASATEEKSKQQPAEKPKATRRSAKPKPTQKAEE